MEELPVEIIACVVKMLDLPCRVKLASCNQTLQQRVYRDCTGAWSWVTFSGLPAAARDRFSDVDLSRLLTRINAREVTVDISLKSCTGINGSGIEPLRHSRVLESICLIGTLADDNPTAFLTHLRTMIPYKLSLVMMSGTSAENPSDFLLGFMQSLRGANRQRSLNDQIQCRCCKQPAIDDSRQVISTKFGGPVMGCLWCGRDFCRRFSCRIGVNECHLCGDSSCSICSGVKACELGCGRFFCNEPQKCCKLKPCDGCKKMSCNDCQVLFTCDVCGMGNNCQACSVNHDICDNGCRLCGNCCKLGKCSVCSNEFCVCCARNNMNMNRCSSCFRMFCDNAFCLLECNMCVVCEASFCQKCQEFQYCEICHTWFCESHDRLVECAKCAISHCRKCSYREICTSCCRGCHEECSCNDKQASKRARLS